MAIAVVQQTALQSPTVASPFNFPGNVAAGNWGAFGFTAFQGAVSAAAIGGTSATRVVQIAQGDDTTQELWIAENLVGGSAAVTFTGSGGFMHARAIEFSGVATSSSQDKHPAATTGTGADPLSNSTGTLAVADEVVFSLIGCNTGGGGHTIPAGWTSLLNIDDWANNSSGAIAYLIVSATTSVAAQWTRSATAWTCEIITFRAPGGGGGGGVVTVDHSSVLSFPTLSRKPKRDDRWARGRCGLWERDTTIRRVA